MKHRIEYRQTVRCQTEHSEWLPGSLTPYAKALEHAQPAQKQKPKTDPAPLASVRSMPDAEEQAFELAMVDKWVALADRVLRNASRKRKRA